MQNFDQPSQQTKEHIINPPQEGKSPLSTEVNVYSKIRDILLIISILFALSVLMFLVYQNGKSIYENGI